MSFSGGKDSTVVVIRKFEEGTLDQIDRIIMADTGMEFEEMYDYVSKIEKYIDRKIEIVKPKISWDDWFYGRYTKGSRKGEMRGFPFTAGCGCWAKRELKLKPIKEIQGKENIIYLGIACDELDRVKRKEYMNQNNKYIFPLVEWGMGEKDCIEFLEKRKLLNPLYKRFKRLGCWCCPKQSINSLKMLYKHYPEKWEKLIKYEKDSPVGFSPNRNLRQLGERFETEIWMEERQMRLEGL